VHERGPHGVFAVHGYPISSGVSTFIVETDEESWRAAGLDEFDVAQPPGASDERTQAYLEDSYASRSTAIVAGQRFAVAVHPSRLLPRGRAERARLHRGRLVPHRDVCRRTRKAISSSRVGTRT
jgi:hypothetical protein